MKKVILLFKAMAMSTFSSLVALPALGVKAETPVVSDEYEDVIARIGEEKTGWSSKWREWGIEHQWKVTVKGEGISNCGWFKIEDLTDFSSFSSPTSQYSFTQTKENRANPLIASSITMHYWEARTLANVFDEGLAETIDGNSNNIPQLDYEERYSAMFETVSKRRQIALFSPTLSAKLVLYGKGLNFRAHIEHVRYWWWGIESVEQSDFNVFYLNHLQERVLNSNGSIVWTGEEL